MSIKKSAVATAAALAAGMTVAGSTVEQLLDNLQGITAMKIVETDAQGRAVLFYTTGSGQTAVTKVVTDTKGDVRIYGDASSAMSAVKRAKVGSTVAVTVRKFDVSVSVGNPTQALIAAHKASVKEVANALASRTEINRSKVSAEAQDWNTQVGTPERAEYDDIVTRLSIVDEWKAAMETRVTALATALTAAGISPTTYQPTV
jgi:leucyl aminopeptidase (aminopeptidase T)